MQGIERLKRMFSTNRENIKCMTHAVGGWPDMKTSEEILCSMIDSGADIIEVQIPFSDPAADGPMIVAANHQALANGVTTRRVLDMLARVRAYADKVAGGDAISLLIMSYLNPVIAYGEQNFINAAVDAGVDGCIIPDCPPDEKNALPEFARAAELAFVPLIAPDTDESRIQLICERFVSPFVYSVLRYGVTGRKSEIDAETKDYLGRVKKASGRAVAAGFGIRERAQVVALQDMVDCFVAGSVFLSAIQQAITAGQSPVDAVRFQLLALTDRDNVNTSNIALSIYD